MSRFLTFPCLVVFFFQCPQWSSCRPYQVLSRSDWLAGGDVGDFHAEAHHLNDAISGAPPGETAQKPHPPTQRPHHRTN